MRTMLHRVKREQIQYEELALPCNKGPVSTTVAALKRLTVPLPKIYDFREV